MTTRDELKKAIREELELDLASIPEYLDCDIASAVIDVITTRLRNAALIHYHCGETAEMEILENMADEFEK